MNSKYFRHFSVFFIMVFLLFASCAPHRQYRINYSTCNSATPAQSCREHAIQYYEDPKNLENSYLLGFIEFDDQGQLWDRKQMSEVLDTITIHSNDKNVLMVVFVHGWKHNAEPEDKNIKNFREILERLSTMESFISRRTNMPSRQVVGIYLGWRGSSVTMPVLKELSFWNRKNTAHKVGNGGVTEVLSRLDLLRKMKNNISGESGKARRSYLAIIGHSFGGAVVYSALSQILEHGVIFNQGPEGQSGHTVGIGDLVVLINPAFEALRYSNLSDMANERRTYFQGQLPVLAILTSEADDATRMAFPIGRWFSTLFENERIVTRENPVTREPEIINQGVANRTTVGHFNQYLTHFLKASGPQAQKLSTAADIPQEASVFFTAGIDWEKDQPGNEIAFTGSTLTRTKNSVGRNPYMNIRVDKELIPDHNDIYDLRIQSFIQQVILLSAQTEALEQRKQLRSAAMKATQ